MNKPSLANSISLIILLTVLLLPSCVAKKKFVEMETSRNRAEQRVRELTDNVNQMEVDFNNFKNEFHYNNSVKDNVIDSLGKEIVHLNSNLNAKSENIEDQIFSFQVEKRRLNQLLADKDKEIRQLSSQISSLDVQLADLKNEEQDSAIKLRNSVSENKSLVLEITQKEDEIEKLRKNLDQKTVEIGKLKSSLTQKDEQIEALQNQVKLLKSQFGKQ